MGLPRERNPEGRNNQVANCKPRTEASEEIKAAETTALDY